MKLKDIMQNCSKMLKSPRKIGPIRSNNATLIGAGLLIVVTSIVIFNPGHIVQRSLSLVGIEIGSGGISQSEQTASSDQDKSNEAEKPDTPTNADDSDNKKADSPTTEPKSRDAGSNSIITPEEMQAHKDNGEPLLIARTDWNVKVNSKSPTSCGTSSNPCSVGQEAKVNISAYNVHTNELLPITECNGSVNKPSAFTNATTTTLTDNKHCEITYSPGQSGMYRLQVELYLSTSVYTDTIYWGGWVWGTDSPTTGGYFVN